VLQLLDNSGPCCTFLLSSETVQGSQKSAMRGSEKLKDKASGILIYMFFVKRMLQIAGYRMRDLRLSIPQVHDLESSEFYMPRTL
jgi:hypothetical protein